jgi:hypothetical protein
VTFVESFIRLFTPSSHQDLSAAPSIWKDPATTHTDVLPAPGGHTETMQQKVRRRDATLDLLLKHPNATVATYV